jgi:energy-coupling factor transporter ATP-binding protein EcfA2
MQDDTEPVAALRLLLTILRRRLDEDLVGVRTLRAFEHRRPEVERLLADLDRHIERMQRAAVVTLVGSTGVGKSTLLNALAGTAIAIEGVDRPTTRQPVIYAPPDSDVSALVAEEITRPAGHDSEGGPVIIRHRGLGPGAGHILIDAPDLNSVDLQHRAAVMALAERSDVLVVVLHHQSVVEAASVSFIDAFAGRRRLLFLLNREDELTEPARAQLMAQIRDLAATRWAAPEAPILSLSARAAQTHPEAPSWTAFQRTLGELVSDSAITSVRRLNALGCATRLQAVFRAIGDDAAPDLDKLSDDAAAGLEGLHRRILSEVADRLAGRHADLTNRLCGEAALRWEGPGGWALRAGTASSLGVGLGAALLRRHPVIAAGAAVSSLAADRLQSEWRDVRLADGGGLAPTRTEFDAWYSEALASARLRASRLTGHANGFHLPNSEGLYAQTAECADDSWETLVTRDIPVAAERSLLRFFRVLLDLPVYALAAWVVYRVAVGFVAGTYVGVDFLINAALILLAYLVPVRIVVGRGLAWRARRLLAVVSQRLTDALAARADTNTRLVRAATSAVQAALTRLGTLADTWRGELIGKS